jgi:DNA gyrase subunit A
LVHDRQVSDLPSPAEDLRIMRGREHVLTAIFQAQQEWADVLALISDTANEDDARAAVRAGLGIDDAQASAVLSLSFRRVSAFDRERVQGELEELRRRVVELTAEMDGRP